MPRRRTRPTPATAAAELAPARRLLFISNGHGEDAIAAQIIRRLPPHLTAEAYPTLGAGSAYAGVCPIVGPRAQLPSEGWRNVRHSVLRDVTGGLLQTLWPGLRFFRSARKAYDQVVVVGDMIGVYGCFLTGVRGILYLDVYKTGFGRDYLPFEKQMLRATTSAVFCRAETLAAGLRQVGVNARCAGNVMMDTIPYGDYDPALHRVRPLALAILPGSRAHAVENFALQAAALARLKPGEMPDIFLPVAPSVPIAALADAAAIRHNPGEWPGDLGSLSNERLTIHLVPGSALGNVLQASNLVLSQAGTATVQALGLGRPVVTFRSAADRASRFEDEQRLFGDARQVVSVDAAEIAQKLRALLADQEERGRLAAIGRQRIGGPGALDAIISAL